jgi:hypothetical protein
MDKGSHPVTLLQSFSDKRICESVYPAVYGFEIEGNIFRHYRHFCGKLVRISCQHFTYSHFSPPFPESVSPFRKWQILKRE